MKKKELLVRCIIESVLASSGLLGRTKKLLIPSLSYGSGLLGRTKKLLVVV